MHRRLTAVHTAAAPWRAVEALAQREFGHAEAVPGTVERLHFLQSPAAHFGHAGQQARVETIETHMSWVFLVGDHALKSSMARSRSVTMPTTRGPVPSLPLSMMTSAPT